MGGPTIGFCGGRIDDADGANSLILGPNEQQEELTPCVSEGLQGQCDGNLGPTTTGLIYVNPAGHLGNPDPEGLIISDIRKTFGKMGMNDTETLSLAGGGHAFGKCHGSCSSPPCGEGSDIGIGTNTFTSGFEGAWTTIPTTWSNQYFTNLFDFQWDLITGPGGQPQWKPSTTDGTPAPDIMMLTSDIALTKDPEFLKISQAFADDGSYLDEQFMHAWYKLTTSDMGPVTRCLGDAIPSMQAFQMPLPAPPATLPDFIPVREQIQSLLDYDNANRGAFIHLAYQCAATFRDTDYQGGCNGAFIRLAGEADWDVNQGTKQTITILEPVKISNPAVSFADIIVLAGQAALEDAGSGAMAFCGGRTDATDGSDRDHLKPIVYDPQVAVIVTVRDSMQVKGLTARQGVALVGMPKSTVLTNTFFVELVAAYVNGDQGDYTDDDFALVQDADFNAIVVEYAANEEAFMNEFVGAWSYMMTADRFDGPTANLCTGVDTPTLESDVVTSSAVSSTAHFAFGTLAAAVLAAVVFAF